MSFALLAKAGSYSNELVHMVRSATQSRSHDFSSMVSRTHYRTHPQMVGPLIRYKSKRVVARFVLETSMIFLRVKSRRYRECCHH